jgi:hypothetical protein
MGESVKQKGGLAAIIALKVDSNSRAWGSVYKIEGEIRDESR